METVLASLGYSILVKKNLELFGSEDPFPWRICVRKQEKRLKLHPGAHYFSLGYIGHPDTDSRLGHHLA